MAISNTYVKLPEGKFRQNTQLDGHENHVCHRLPGVFIPRQESVFLAAQAKPRANVCRDSLCYCIYLSYKIPIGV